VDSYDLSFPNPDTMAVGKGKKMATQAMANAARAQPLHQVCVCVYIYIYIWLGRGRGWPLRPWPMPRAHTPCTRFFFLITLKPRVE